MEVRQSPLSPPRRFARSAMLVAIGRALAAGTIAASALPATAFAAEAAPARKAYDIPAGPLEAALNRFGREAGILLSFPTETTAGLHSNGLSGSHTVTAGLALLLQGSGLAAVAQPNGGYALLKREPASAAAAPPAPEKTLDAITVKSGIDAGNATGPVVGYVAASSSTASKTATPTREMPQSISVVTRASLDARGVSNLAEALEYLPGFTPRTYGRDDRYDWSIARGIGNTNGANFRDGLKDSGHNYAVPRLNSYGVERVEFLRGPASLLFGSNIPGGAVNSITKRPTEEAQGEIRVRGGEIHRRGVAGDISGPIGSDGAVLYRLVALNEKYDLMTPDTSKEERYFAPSFTFKPGRDTELTLLANYQEDRIDGDAYPYNYYEAVGRYIKVAEKGWDRFYLDQWSAALLLDHRFNDALSLHSRSRYSRVKLDYRINFLDGVVSDTVVTRRPQQLQDEAKAWQSDNYLEAKWNAGKWSNTTIAGVDLRKLTGALYRADGASVPYDTVQGRGIGAFSAPALAPNYISDTRQTGLYVQNQAKYDERFVIVAGLRRDRYREVAEAEWVDGPVRQNKTTGRLGAVWLLPAGVSPYVGYANSFEPQSGATYEGASFKPTTGRQYEAGVRYEPAGVNAMLTAAVFDILQQNVPATDPSHPGFSVQRGEVGSRGVELEANASLAQGLDLTASYSYTDAKVKRDTNPALVGLKNGLVPAHKAALWVNASLPAAWGRGVKVGMGARYTGKVPDFDNTRWVPGVTVFDARLGYQFGTHWEVAVNARNLFDKEHLGNCSYGSCYPSDRREVIATVNYRW